MIMSDDFFNFNTKNNEWQIFLGKLSKTNDVSYILIDSDLSFIKNLDISGIIRVKNDISLNDFSDNHILNLKQLIDYCNSNYLDYRFKNLDISENLDVSGDASFNYLFANEISAEHLNLTFDNITVNNYFNIYNVYIDISYNIFNDLSADSFYELSDNIILNKGMIQKLKNDDTGVDYLTGLDNSFAKYLVNKLF